MFWPLQNDLRALGLNVDDLVARFGISPSELRDPHCRFPYESFVAVWQAAIDQTGDEALGLHVAERYHPGAFGLLDYLAHSSVTLGDAARHLCRFNRLLHDVAETTFEVGGDRAFLGQRILSGVHRPRAITENVIANFLVIARELTRVEVKPIEVRFTHAEPPYSSEYERLFRCVIRFGAERDGLMLHRDTFDLKLPSANPGLAAELERSASQLVTNIPRASTQLSARVRAFMQEQLCEGSLRAEVIARKFGVTERTMRRRLQNEGTSYELILESLRQQLAERFLEESELSVDDVAFKLGFVEVNAFRRAFRRWRGMTPTQYRRNRIAARGSVGGNSPP